jgi:ABC-type antimicrobial peptide transport system permease subunit
MVSADRLLLIGAGLAAGIALRLALADLIRSQIYGMSARDPPTFIGSVLVLTMAAGLAGFIPALRASSVHPTVALREE